ncbi:hypothetical protein Tco_0300759 [Tanacetum coccineum]
MPTMRTAEVDMIKNDEAMEINLDLLEEKREHVAIQEAKNKAKMEKYYNAKVSSIRFCPGDLVYWNNEASRAKDGGGMELAEAKVVDKAVVVPVAPGTLMEVLTKPTRFQTDKGLDKGVQTPRRADRFSVIFALILSTQE